MFVHLMIFAGLLVSLLAPQAALSQVPAGSQTQRKPAKPYLKNDAQAEHTVQQQPAQLPDLPLYSGKIQWRYTLVCPKVKGGPTYTMRFEAKEDPQTVLAWYCDTLRSSRWIFKQSLGSITGRSADGNTVVVNCYGKSRGDYKSNVTIVYKQFRQ